MNTYVKTKKKEKTLFERKREMLLDYIDEVIKIVKTEDSEYQLNYNQSTNDSFGLFSKMFYRLNYIISEENPIRTNLDFTIVERKNNNIQGDIYNDLFMENLNNLKNNILKSNDKSKSKLEGSFKKFKTRTQEIFKINVLA